MNNLCDSICKHKNICNLSPANTETCKLRNDEDWKRYSIETAGDIFGFKSDEINAMQGRKGALKK